MRNRKLATLALSATALAGVLAAAPAASADTVTTTFAVSAGTLSVASADTVADLGSSTAGLAGTTVTGTLPTVTVTDARGSIAGWTSKIASTDFSDGAGHTIAASKAKAYILATDGPTVVSGIVTPTTTALLPASGVALSSTAATLVTATAAVGANQVSYTPTVQVTIDANVLAGTYTGTITHSVL